MSPRKPPTLLIVDDDELLTHRLAQLAREVGIRCSLAHDGVQALGVIDRVAPDMVVTDIHMPRLGGRALVPLLRKMPHLANRPIIVLTADSSRSAKIELLEAGADDFIVKPVDPDEFQARLLALARQCDLVTDFNIVRGERDAALRKLEERNKELEYLTLGLVAALEKANTLNDSATGFHIRRVSLYAGMLAEEAGSEPRFVENIRRFAGLHDVGKVGLRDAVLKKEGPLTPDEREEMKAHTLIGAELLREAGLPQLACNIALCHHEKWDGTGYPRGLSGEQIPLEARIVSVVDVYDALRSRRCYKDPFDEDRTFSIMEEEAGRHFDPELVDLFVANIDKARTIEDQYPDEVELAEAWG